METTKPWKLLITWLDPRYPVEVELHVMDAEPVLLRRFPRGVELEGALEAVRWAKKYIHDRGCKVMVGHLPEDDPGFVYLHAGPPLKG